MLILYHIYPESRRLLIDSLHMLQNTTVESSSVIFRLQYFVKSCGVMGFYVVRTTLCPLLKVARVTGSYDPPSPVS